MALKLAVLVSGRGSNLQALIDACGSPDFPATIALVVSNVAGVEGLERAAAAGIPVRVIPHGDYGNREAFEAVLDSALREAGVDLVCLAGFMRLLTSGFVEAWRDRLINIHPSLLPAFRGLNTHARALDAGARIHGCTVHFVRPEMDDGPVIIQAAVPVLSDDDDAALAARVLAVEHRCYPAAVRLIADGRVRMTAGGVSIDAGADAGVALFSPGLEG